MRLKKILWVTGFAVLTIAGCKTGQLASVWADGDITIDGSRDDWTTGMVVVAEHDLAIGIVNDADKLYLSIVISEPRMITRAVMSGFTVWVDGNGGTRKRLGVRYPLPNQAMLNGQMQRSKMLGEFPSQERLELLLNSQLNIEMIGSRKADVLWLPLDNTQDVEVAMAFAADGRLIYELSLPLVAGANRRYAPDAQPGDKIGIGFEMSQPGMSRKNRAGGAMADGRMPGGLGGGRDGGGRGMGGARGMGGDHGGRGGIEPVKYWGKVILAVTPQM